MTKVAQASVPLYCAPPLNVYTKMHFSKKRKTKTWCLTAMLASGMSHQRIILPGRPHIKMTRYSSSQPDRDSAWTKIPLDCLKAGQGLGYIYDDSPRDIDLTTEWIKAQRKSGRVVIEVWA